MKKFLFEIQALSLGSWQRNQRCKCCGGDLMLTGLARHGIILDAWSIDHAFEILIALQPSYVGLKGIKIEKENIKHLSDL